MKKTKIAFFDTKPYDRKSFEDANKKHEFEIKYFYDHLHPDTAGLAKGFDVVCVFVNDIIDKQTTEVLVKNGVKLIALRCAGYNNVDLEAVNGKVRVVRVPAYSPYAVAEHAAALMLCLNRKIHKAYYRVRDGNFLINGLLGFDFCEKNAGVIGTGKIGKCLIPILKGMGMNIYAYDPYPDKEYAKENNIQYVDLPTLFSESRVISLHCPMTHDNHHMINEETISQMKEGVMLINTSRGKLIDTKALIEGLKCGKIGAAGLDVYEEESEYFFEDFSEEIIGDDMLARLMTFPNVLITSHQGFFTHEALFNIAKTTFENIIGFFEGGDLKNEVCYKRDKVAGKSK